MKSVFIILALILSTVTSAGVINLTIRPKEGRTFDESIQVRMQMKAAEKNPEHNKLMNQLVQKSLEFSGCQSVKISSVNYNIYGGVYVRANAQNCADPKIAVIRQGQLPLPTLFCEKGSLVDLGIPYEPYNISLTSDVVFSRNKTCKED
ncbi:MAG: hypothetical protein A4S09_11860 [Proteobacteria bacterium SG_bin7]|nr:MAG: hypothetical protein A4S09_11860 [Proteobacteria bacterium SG_bin7]